ncbi:MAG TPA: hypothetical protein VNH20_09895 [Candidatus Dormibacteraeota bacterium]|nr:hypothetical protein [Candidatus Dormibacteraeota bacterium]
MATRALVLAIDGSARTAPLVVLVGADGSLEEQDPAAGKDLTLTRSVRAVLASHRERIGLVVASSGPGSYIGVRGGLAAALGAAQGLACPIALVGSLVIVAASVDPAAEPILALADAGRGGTYGQAMVPEQRPGLNPGWRPEGGSELLARELPWPERWASYHFAVGTPGEGRDLPPGTRSLRPVRDPRTALAWLLRVPLAANSGYDQVSADYAEPVGARKWS